MKTLTTEQQEDLLKFFLELQQSDVMPNPDYAGPINYWCIELKPKRARNKEKIIQGMKEAVIYAKSIDTTQQA